MKSKEKNKNGKKYRFAKKYTHNHLKELNENNTGLYINKNK